MTEPTEPIFICTIPGKPHGSARMKAVCVRGVARVYPPDSNTAFRKRARVRIKSALRAWNLTAPVFPRGPVRLDYVAVFAVPKSRERIREPVSASWHVDKPDRDNIEKALKDAGTGLLWTDDSQVAFGVAAKIEHDQGEPARIELIARPAPSIVTALGMLDEIAAIRRQLIAARQGEEP